jgi:formate hydrogenlyase subunit 3/multisubunit Na+/H+ antiporter MnhD subunit
LSLSRKLLRLLSLICGILLVVISPFFIFHTEKADQPYPFTSRSGGGPVPPGTIYLNYNFCSILFGVFLLMAGIVLIVASYYHHEETRE